MELLDDVILALRKMHQPVIGAINGAAIGGGFCLARGDRHPDRVGAGVLPGGRHQQRPHRQRAGHQLPAAARHRLVAGLRDHAVGPRRRRRRSRAHRSGVARRSRPTSCSTAATRLAERIIGFSRVGVEITKRLLWSSLDAGSLHAHMDHEGHAQLYVRLTTENFEEAVRARKDHRAPVFGD